MKRPSASLDKAALVEGFEKIVAQVLEKTAASRATLRIDLPAIGAMVNLPVAESLTPGARSLRGVGAINQRAAATVQWLERHREPLIQNDFQDEPKPPQALVDAYGTQAQMLGPVILDGTLAGWISVHENSGPRRWRDSDVAALRDATEAVTRLAESFAASRGTR